MPYVNATPLPAFGWVRLEVDWTDTPGVTYARVERVVPGTGEVTPIRPNTAYSGWYQQLSAGTALMYDTEAPLDTPFYYRTDSLNNPGVYLMVSGEDTFDRAPVIDGWGTATDGEPWTHFGGPDSAYSVAGV